MQVDVSCHVSTNYRVVQEQIRRAAAGELKREMTEAINKAAKPAADAVYDGAPSYMPRRGGYAAALVRDLTLRVSKSAGGVRITAQANGRDVGSREKGSLRHPVYGRHRVSHRRRRFTTNPWATQRTRPGFFTEPIRAHRDNVQRAIVDAVQLIADKIGG